MQSRGARALVALGSIALIFVLLVVLSGGEEEAGEEEAATPAAATTTAGAAASGGSDQGSGERPDEPEEPAGPAVERIVVVGGQPEGGVRELDYDKGERIRLVVRSDVDEHVHVHGYDLYEDVAAGGRAKFSFPADIDGIFEIELEDSGVQLAELRVRP